MRAVLTALDDAMLHRGRDQESYGQHQQRQAGALQCARHRRQLIVLVLKDRVELETEQYLRAEDQKPIFIQRGFELIIDRHLMIWKGDGGPARPRFETRTAA